MSYRTLVRFPSDLLFVSFPNVLLYDSLFPQGPTVREFPQCLTARECDSPVSYRTWVSLPSVLPYVSESPQCLAVREGVSPVTYST